MEKGVTVIYCDTWGKGQECIICKTMTNALNFIDADIEVTMFDLLCEGYEPELIYGCSHIAEVYVPDTSICAWWDIK